jgi:hypothetical protein
MKRGPEKSSGIVRAGPEKQPVSDIKKTTQEDVLNAAGMDALNEDPKFLDHVGLLSTESDIHFYFVLQDNSCTISCIDKTAGRKTRYSQKISLGDHFKKVHEAISRTQTSQTANKTAWKCFDIGTPEKAPSVRMLKEQLLALGSRTEKKAA